MARDSYSERQAARDREYLEACKAAGIKPELPHYDLNYRQDDEVTIENAHEKESPKVVEVVSDHSREREAMLALLLWVLQGRTASQIVFRLKLILWSINPELGGGYKTQAELCKNAFSKPYTRANACKVLKQFISAFGVSMLHSTKPSTYRKKCSKRQKQVWQRLKQQKSLTSTAATNTPSVTPAQQRPSSKAR